MDEVNKNIKVNVKLSDKDLSEMNMLYYKVSKKRNKRIRVIITTLVIIFAVVLGIVKSMYDTTIEISQDSHSFGKTLLILLVILFTLIIILKLSIPLINKYTSKKQYESNKLIQQETEYSVSFEGVQIISECLQLKWKYKDIYRVVETLNYIMLFESTRIVRLIPKRCFHQEEEQSNFTNIIKEYLSPEKYEYYKV